jgi:hypothetical protein
MMIAHPQYVALAFVLLIALSFCVRVEPKTCEAARGLEYDRMLAEAICK